MSSCWIALWSMRATVSETWAHNFCDFYNGFFSVPVLKFPEKTPSHLYLHKAFSVYTPAELWLSCHDVTFFLWPRRKRQKLTQKCDFFFQHIEGCFSFINTPEKPVVWWKVRRKFDLAVPIGHYYDLVISEYHNFSAGGDGGSEGVGLLERWTKLEMFNKAMISPTALFLSLSWDDWHQM